MAGRWIAKDAFPEETRELQLPQLLDDYEDVLVEEEPSEQWRPGSAICPCLPKKDRVAMKSRSRLMIKLMR